MCWLYGPQSEKSAFRILDKGGLKAGLKPVSSAAETSLKIEILPVASLDMTHFKKQPRKVLISLG